MADGRTGAWTRRRAAPSERPPPDPVLQEAVARKLRESELPEHLRDDAPFVVCPRCGRKSWGSKVGDGCGMSQPDGSRCGGTFQEAGG